MNSLVIYGSRYGNTRRVAEAIAAELRKHGEATLVDSEYAEGFITEHTDLVVIGGPTEGHRMSVPVAQLFQRFESGALEGKAAAAFDTRMHWPLLLSGSAAAGIMKKLEQAGARVIAPAGSFFVGGKPTLLEPGELEQATAWAASLAASLAAKLEPLEALVAAG